MKFFLGAVWGYFLATWKPISIADWVAVAGIGIVTGLLLILLDRPK